jgi:nucleotide-binding universal stress UspA family protein
MIMPSEARRIVVGIDGSDSSLVALRWADWLARTTDAALDVVCAWEYPSFYGWSEAPDNWNPSSTTETVLSDSLRAVFGDSTPSYVATSVRQGGAAMVLLDESAGATLVVVGSRGHGGFAGLLLGSVSASVAEHAPCPVLVVHGEQLPPS